jgi:hypothetical protein
MAVCPWSEPGHPSRNPQEDTSAYFLTLFLYGNIFPTWQALANVILPILPRVFRLPDPGMSEQLAVQSHRDDLVAFLPASTIALPSSIVFDKGFSI